jgi:hypothetical protein
MSTDKIKLNASDWDEIFSTETYKIGKTSIQLRPLGMEDLAIVAQIISQVREEIIAKWPANTKNKKTSDIIAEVMPAIISIIQIEIPEALERLSNIEKEDIIKLPASIAMDLAIKCLDINLGSMESLSKNFMALVIKATTLSQGLKNMSR